MRSEHPKKDKPKRIVSVGTYFLEVIAERRYRAHFILKLTCRCTGTAMQSTQFANELRKLNVRLNASYMRSDHHVFAYELRT